MCRAVVEHERNLSAIPHLVVVILNEPLCIQVTGHPRFGVVPLAHRRIISKASATISETSHGSFHDKGQLLVTSVYIGACCAVTHSLLFLPPAHVSSFEAWVFESNIWWNKYGFNGIANVSFTVACNDWNVVAKSCFKAIIVHRRGLADNCLEYYFVAKIKTVTPFISGTKIETPREMQSLSPWKASVLH